MPLNVAPLRKIIKDKYKNIYSFLILIPSFMTKAAEFNNSSLIVIFNLSATSKLNQSSKSDGLERNTDPISLGAVPLKQDSITFPVSIPIL